MSDDPCGFVVNVFGSPEAAERAAATLVSDGFSPEQLAVVSGADQVPGLAESLEECGVPRADAAYFADEVRGGRALVAVRCHASDCKGVRVTLGRHGGMVHVPTELCATGA